MESAIDNTNKLIALIPDIDAFNVTPDCVTVFCHGSKENAEALQSLDQDYEIEVERTGNSIALIYQKIENELTIKIIVL